MSAEITPSEVKQQTATKTALTCAQEGDFKTLHFILEQNPDAINESDEKGLSPLHHAAYFDEGECAKLLLSCCKCDVNKKTNRGCTPLHIASVSGSSRVLAQLVQREDKLLNAQNDYGETALHLACAAGTTSAISTLLDAGASATITDRWNRTPCQVAYEQGSIDALDVFKKQGFEYFPTKMIPDVSHSSAQLNQEANIAHQDIINEFMIKLKTTNDQEANISGGLKLPSTNTMVEVKGIFKSETSPLLEVDVSTVPSSAEASIAAQIPKCENLPTASSTSVVISSAVATPPPPPPPPPPCRSLSKLVEFPGDPVEISAFLQDATVNPAGKDMFGLTALMKFAAWDKLDLIDLLLPHLSSAEVNATSPKNMFSCLHHAAAMGAGRAFNKLYHEDAVDNSLLDSEGKTALEIACENGVSVIEG